MKTNITAFDRANVNKFSKELEAAMKKVADEFGVDLTFGSGSYTDASFTTKMTVSLRGEGGEVKLSSSLLGLIEIMGMLPVNARGQKILSHTNRGKYTWTYSEPNGQRYRITDSQAKAMFANPNAPKRVLTVVEGRNRSKYDG